MPSGRPVRRASRDRSSRRRARRRCTSTTFVPIPLITDIRTTARTRFMTEPMTMIRNLWPRDLAIMSSGGMGRSFSKTPSPCHLDVADDREQADLVVGAGPALGRLAERELGSGRRRAACRSRTRRPRRAPRPLGHEEVAELVDEARMTEDDRERDDRSEDVDHVYLCGTSRRASRRASGRCRRSLQAYRPAAAGGPRRRRRRRRGDRRKEDPSRRGRPRPPLRWRRSGPRAGCRRRPGPGRASAKSGKRRSSTS